MALRIIVPFKFHGAKSRLAPVLSPYERELFALAMLRDVLEAVSWAGDVTILARPGFDGSGIAGIEVVQSSLDLNDAINSLIEDSERQGLAPEILIAMADLAILTREDVKGIIQTKGDVVLSPGRGGGTNMILVRNQSFRTCYQGLSYPKHLDLAHKMGMNAGIYASYRSGCDIDEPEDLAEVLIHSRGRARSLLEEFGFQISPDGRAKCARKAL